MLFDKMRMKVHKDFFCLYIYLSNNTYEYKVYNSFMNSVSVKEWSNLIIVDLSSLGAKFKVHLFECL